MLSIKLTDVTVLQAKNTKIVGDFHDYFINKGSLSPIKRGLTTENINSCTAGVLQAGDKHFMFHAAPEMQSLKTVKSELEKQIKSLKKACDDIKGLICGGWELNTNSPQSVKSFDLYNTIADALDNLGVKFTMICGKEKDSPMDNLYSFDKKITLWNKSMKDLPTNNSKKLSEDDILDALENHYQFVEKNSDDKLNLELKSVLDKNLVNAG